MTNVTNMPDQNSSLVLDFRRTRASHPGIKLVRDAILFQDDLGSVALPEDGKIIVGG